VSGTATTPVRVVDVLAAGRRIAGRVRRTPLIESAWLSRATGGRVFLKLETVQLTNSFKIRGAYNALLLEKGRRASCSENRKKTPDVISVVTASAGNHGRALACAAESLGIHATIFTPRNAAATKLDAIRRHGADLRSIAADYDEAERLAKQLARDEGTTFVSAYSNPDVIAGAGTVALEIMEDLPAIDVVVCPIGGGGLMSGIASTLRQLSSSCQIVGVEAAASPAFHASLAAGRITTIDVLPTLADGLAGNMDPDSITFDVIRRTVDRVELVSEGELAGAIRALVAEEHLIAEGSGIAGVAAVLGGRLDLAGRTTAIVLSGANIDLQKLATLLAG
jgi:threonine dehydratase